MSPLKAYRRWKKWYNAEDRRIIREVQAYKAFYREADRAGMKDHEYERCRPDLYEKYRLLRWGVKKEKHIWPALHRHRLSGRARTEALIDARHERETQKWSERNSTAIRDFADRLITETGSSPTEPGVEPTGEVVPHATVV